MIDCDRLPWSTLEQAFPACACRLHSIWPEGRAFLVEDLVRGACTAADAARLLDRLAADGVFSKVEVFVCPGTARDVLPEYDPDAEACPQCGARYDEVGPPRPATQYQRVTPPLRSVPAVITIHGMNTPGAWQERLGLLLSAMHGRSIPMYAFKYGIVRPGVLFRWRQRQLTRRLVLQIRGVVAALGEDRPYGSRPDVIAHSFGTWLLANALNTQADLEVGRVILTGCIVPPDFDWNDLGGRVDQVLNHFGGKDFWARIAGYLIPGSGPSGRRGFDPQPRLVQVAEPGFTHSAHFDEENLDRVFREVWEPFLACPAPTLPRLARGAPTRWKPIPALFRAGLLRWLLILDLLLVAGAVAVGAAWGAVWLGTAPRWIWPLGLAGLSAVALLVVLGLGHWRGWDR